MSKSWSRAEVEKTIKGLQAIAEDNRHLKGALSAVAMMLRDLDAERFEGKAVTTQAPGVPQVTFWRITGVKGDSTTTGTYWCAQCRKWLDLREWKLCSHVRRIR